MPNEAGRPPRPHLHLVPADAVSPMCTRVLRWQPGGPACPWACAWPSATVS